MIAPTYLVQLAIGASDSSTSPFRVEIHQIDYVETTCGASTAIFQIQTPDLTSFRRLVNKASETGTPYIYFRFGYGERWYPVQKQVIVSPLSMPSNTVAGEHARIKTADPLFSINRFCKTIARQGPISGIVSTILQENKLQKSIVEPTADNQQQSSNEQVQGQLLIQSYQTDYDFIVNRVLPRSTNDQGFGNYRFFYQDDSVHFHTPSYYTDVKEINVFGTVGVDTTALLDTTQERLRMGALGVRAVTYDTINGKTTTVESSSSKVENFAKIDNPVLTNATADAATPILRHTSEFGQLEESSRIAQCIYAGARLAYGIKLTLQLSPFIRAGDFVNIVAVTSKSVSTEWAGLWYVASITHHMNTNEGSSMSTLTLERGELFGKAATALGTLLDANQLLASKSMNSGNTMRVGTGNYSTVTRQVSVTPDGIPSIPNSSTDTGFPPDSTIVT